MSANTEDIIEAEIIDLSTWEAKLNELAAEDRDTQIRLPAKLRGRRVNREEVANAFLTSFEMIGGLPRLALWADGNYNEFVKIFGRLLPKEVLTTHDGEVVVKHMVPTSALDGETGE